MRGYVFRWYPRHDALLREMYLRTDPVILLADIAAEIGVTTHCVRRRLKKLGIAIRKPPFVARNGINPVGMTHRGSTVVGVVPSANTRNRIAILRCDTVSSHEYERHLFSIRDETAGGCPMCRRDAMLGRHQAAAEARRLKPMAERPSPSARKSLFMAVKTLRAEQRDVYQLYRRKGFNAHESVTYANTTPAHPRARKTIRNRASTRSRMSENAGSVVWASCGAVGGMSKVPVCDETEHEASDTAMIGQKQTESFIL